MYAIAFCFNNVVSCWRTMLLGPGRPFLGTIPSSIIIFSRNSILHLGLYAKHPLLGKRRLSGPLRLSLLITTKIPRKYKNQLLNQIVELRDNSKNCCCYFAKNNLFVNLQLNKKNVTQTERQKLAQNKSTKNAELNSQSQITDQRRFESRARLKQDSKHSAPFETEDEAKFQTNYYTSIIIYKRVHIEKLQTR